MKPGLGPNFRRALSDASGVTAVEFAFVAPIIIGLLLATIQSAIIWVAKTELLSATQAAARLVFTGQTSTIYNSKASFQTALCAKLPILIPCDDVMISLAPQASLSAVSTSAPTLTYSGSGAVTNSFAYNIGSPAQIMVLQVLYQMPAVAGPLFDAATQANGEVLLVATVVFQNEPQ